jgi:F-type H+-transporting ATPase subunit c
MKNKLSLLLFVMMFCALPMFAADGSTSSVVNLAPLAAGLGMAIASGLCALGQGNAVKGAAEAMARNPGAAGAIRFALILGLVLIESLALYTFIIILIKS